MSWIYEAVKEKGKEPLVSTREEIDSIIHTENSLIVKLTKEIPLSIKEKVKLCEEIKKIDPDINLRCKVLRVDTRVYDTKDKRHGTSPSFLEDIGEKRVINSSGKGERAYPVEKKFEELTEPTSESLLVITRDGDVTFQRKGFGTTHLKRFSVAGKEETFKKILDTIASIYGLEELSNKKQSTEGL